MADRIYKALFGFTALVFAGHVNAAKIADLGGRAFFDQRNEGRDDFILGFVEKDDIPEPRSIFLTGVNGGLLLMRRRRR